MNASVYPYTVRLIHIHSIIIIYRRITCLSVSHHPLCSILSSPFPSVEPSLFRPSHPLLITCLVHSVYISSCPTKVPVHRTAVHPSFPTPSHLFIRSVWPRPAEHCHYTAHAVVTYTHLTRAMPPHEIVTLQTTRASAFVP